MRTLAPILLFAAASTVAGAASAKCMMPSAALVPPSGKVPVGAKLRLLLPQFTRAAKPPVVTAKLGNKSVPVIVGRLDSAPADLDAYLVQLGTSAAGAVVVELQAASGGVAGSWNLDVDPSWKAPAIAKEVPKLGHIATSWTCSHERSTQLAFTGGADGYRVILADKKADLADPKKAQSVYLPSSPGAFFGRLQPSPADLRLGFLNCFGETYAFGTASVWAEIHALLPDGSEPLVTATPIQIGAP